MDEQEVIEARYRAVLGLMMICTVGGAAFLAGILWADEPRSDRKEPRVVYPRKTDLDFEGVRIEGEIRNPGEFYFQRRSEEKFDSLVKRRKNFHREMLRDAVLSK